MRRARSNRTDEVRSALDRAAELVDDGRLVDAVDTLADAQRVYDDPEVASTLVDLRLAAADSYDAGSGRAPWPPHYADPFPECSGRIPEITPAELSADVLGGAVTHHRSEERRVGKDCSR